MRTVRHWLRERLQRWPRVYGPLRSLNARMRAAGEPTEGPPLPDDAFRARIVLVDPPSRAEVGDPFPVHVEIRNASPRTWPGGRRVALAYHWRRRDGSVWGMDGGRARLRKRLGAGAATRLTCLVVPPGTPGTYELELELVYGRATWFGARGSETARHEIAVGGMPPEKFGEVDYEQIYVEADLTKNFWALVGPATLEEFRQLGAGKLEMLKALGMKPESKILDVGCGTGSVAEACAGFLGDGGLYYGTDLSEVAIQFCRETYRRPNFQFAKNGMDTLPIDGVRFDFIVFFSVFTHTYPAETQELMAAAARLLDDDGMIIADVFEADIEGDSIGTRAMVVLDRRRMPAIADAIDLEATMIGDLDWNPGDARPIVRMMWRFAKRRAAVTS